MCLQIVFLQIRLGELVSRLPHRRQHFFKVAAVEPQNLIIAAGLAAVCHLVMREKKDNLKV